MQNAVVTFPTAVITIILKKLLFMYIVLIKAEVSVILHIWANSITSTLLEHKIIQSDKRDIYAYGMEYLLATFISTALVITVSIFTHMFFETLTFLLTFSIIRGAAGGYHADSHLKCIIIFICVYVLNMTVLVYCLNHPEFKVYLSFINLLSVCAIFVFAPVEHKNRPFTDKEYKGFKVKSRLAVLALAITATAGMTLLNTYGSIFISVSLGVATTAASVAVANIRGKGDKNESIKTIDS